VRTHDCIMESSLLMPPFLAWQRKLMGDGSLLIHNWSGEIEATTTTTAAAAAAATTITITTTT